MKWTSGRTLQGLLLCMACMASPAFAAKEAVLDQARELLAERAQAGAQAMDARIEIHLGQIAQERLKQAPCAPEAYVPPGTRPTGKTYVGLRCADSSWQVRIPADVALFVKVPVMTRPARIGDTLQQGDWSLEEVNLAMWPRGVHMQDDDLPGAQVRHQVRAGEPIPVDALQSRSQLAAGDPVQVVLIGQGFTVKATGKVLQQVSPGQSARVQLDTGRTVAGTLRDDREIEVRL